MRNFTDTVLRAIAIGAGIANSIVDQSHASSGNT
jgi:hypothetical protein